MKILNIQAHRGPNVWSTEYPKLIQLRLEIEEKVRLQELKVVESLEKFVPGFSVTNNDKTDLPFLVGKLAITLLRQTGYEVNYIFVKPTAEQGVFNVVFEYKNEDTGKLAAKSAVHILTAVLEESPVATDDLLLELREIADRYRLDPFTEDVLKVCKKRDIPVLLDEDEQSIQLGYGMHLKRFNYNMQQGLYPPADITPTEFIDNLFPPNSPSRIPIIAITGTNGKTTTSRLTSHILQTNGINTGYTTSDGIYVGSELIDKGDTTGPVSAQKVLGDERVEVAVLECARGGIVRAGLGFDQCDISVVTNIQEDHLGLSDIHTLQELAAAKGIIIDVLKKEGYAICNAENEYSLKLGQNAKSNLALFSLDKENPQILEQINKGGLAGVAEQGTITIIHGNQIIPVAHVDDIPITFGGKVAFMIQNVLAATIACYIYGLKPAQIAKGLASFHPSVEQTPGRLNIFEFKDFKVMVDFAHNPDGFRGIRDFMAAIDSPFKIGIITGTGDRRYTDLLELGSLSAQMFDHIIISQRKFLRGRSAQEIVDNLIEGIKSQKPEAVYEYIPDDIEPLTYAMSLAKKNSFICALSDVLDDPLTVIPKLIAEEK